jgi:hypothetical protein
MLKIKEYKDLCVRISSCLQKTLFNPSKTNRKHILKPIDQNFNKYIEEINDIGISKGKEFICYPKYKKQFNQINANIFDLIEINRGNEIILTKPEQINKNTKINWDIVKKCKIFNDAPHLEIICNDMEKFWHDEYFHKYMNALYNNNNYPKWLYANPEDPTPETIRHITEYHLNNLKNAKMRSDLISFFVRVPEYLYNYSTDDKSLQFYTELNFIDKEIKYCMEQVDVISDELKKLMYSYNLKKEIEHHGSIQKYLDNCGGDANDLFWDDGKSETRWIKNMVFAIKENNCEEFVKNYDPDYAQSYPLPIKGEQINKISSNKNVENDGHTYNTFFHTFLSAQKYLKNKVDYIEAKLNA